MAQGADPMLQVLLAGVTPCLIPLATSITDTDVVRLIAGIKAALVWIETGHPVPEPVNAHQ
jgi:hypothetical protein